MFQADYDNNYIFKDYSTFITGHETLPTTPAPPAAASAPPAATGAAAPPPAILTGLVVDLTKIAGSSGEAPLGDSIIGDADARR